MRRSFWFVLLLLFVVLAACEPDTNDEGKGEPKLPPPNLPIAARQAPKLEVGSTTEAVLDPAGGARPFGPTTSGLDFTLTDAEAPKRVSSSSEQETETEALSAEEAAALLARLPDLPAADTADFALRAATLKPPLAGSDIQTPFPPNDTLPPPTAEALAQPSVLKVLRYQPQGVVGDIPKLSVTFSSPMVPLSSISEAHKGAVPLSLEPQLEGEWRWLDTKTLQFLPAKPLTLSTRYVVSAKKGTKSETGAVLEEAFSWAFETPRINLTGTSPSGADQELNPIIDLGFDQPIDARAVLNTVTVSDGSRTYGTRLLSQQRTPPGWATPGQSLAFELTETLPKATNITVQVGPGTPSKAGPLLTETAPSFSFQTYGPFYVSDVRCGYCYAGENPVSISLSNSMGAQSFAPSKVTVSPAIKDMVVTGEGSWIQISGTTKPDVDYVVTLSGRLEDTHGQKLGGELSHKVRFSVRPPAPEPPIYYSLSPNGHQLVYRDPGQPPAFSFTSTNFKQLKVELYSVTPEDYPGFINNYVQKFDAYNQGVTEKLKLPGKRISSKMIDIQGARDEAIVTQVDLAPALDKNGLGHAILFVEEPTWGGGNGYHQAFYYWFESTHLGITAAADPEELTAWLTSLDTGTPIDGAKVTTLGVTDGEPVAQGKTDSNGLVKLAPTPGYLVAHSGDDSVFETADQWVAYGRSMEQLVAWHVIDDRALYKPGETVQATGWVRLVDLKEGGDVGHLKDQSLHYQFVDPYGIELLAGDTKLGGLGTFDMKVTLPDTVNLGSASLNLTLTDSTSIPGAYFTHTFTIEEFRRPEFEVTIATGGPYLAGDIVVPVNARYYSGGALPDAPTTWHVSAQQSHYVPPNRGDFAFGTSYPDWMNYGYSPASAIRTHEGKTDVKGTHNVRVDIVGGALEKPVLFTVESSVQDLNQQRWTANGSFTVHPSELYLGMRPSRSFVQAGDLIQIDSIVSDIDGALVLDHPIEIRGARLEWTASARTRGGSLRDTAVLGSERDSIEGGVRERVMVDTQLCQTKSVNGLARCTFKAPKGGSYVFSGTVMDAKERVAHTELAVLVAGGESSMDALNHEAVLVLADRDEYLPGETAELVVQSPWPKAQGIMTVRRAGIVETRIFSVENFSQTLKIKVTEALVPGFGVQIDLVSSAPRIKDGKYIETLPARPAYATGYVRLSVPPMTRTLSVQAIPRDEVLQPGAESVVDVAVYTAFGEPVENADVALVIIDDSVLALAGYELADPVSPFYPERNDDARVSELRALIPIVDCDGIDRSPIVAPVFNPAPAIPGFGGQTLGGGDDRVIYETTSAEMDMADMERTMGDSAAKSESAPSKSTKMPAPAQAPADAGTKSGKAIALRTNFDALVAFQAHGRTDENGRLALPFKLPDNLTRYRVMVVAAAEAKYFGKTESTLTAQRDLMVRASPPRFMNFGDRFELPVLVQNLGDKPMTVELAMRSNNAEIEGSGGFRFTVAAQDRVELELPVRALEPGKAHFQVVASAGELDDAAEFVLPVWTPATTEAFAVYGELDQGAIVQPVLAPEDANPSFGGLEISTSSTAVAALTDAVIYLVDYPYDATENLASQLMGVAALRDVLSAFDAPGLPSEPELLALVDANIEELSRRQRGDGGFNYWSDYESVPYISIHTIHALWRAQHKGFEVGAQVMALATRYVDNIEANISAYERRYDFHYDPQTRAALKAYALYVRALMGEDASAEAKALLANPGLDGMTLESAGWLMVALSRATDPDSKAEVAKISSFLQNRVEETAAAANFVTSYSGEGAQAMLHSERRTDAVLLDALIEAEPGNLLIPKVVRGLLAHRRKGAWRNTQENVFALVALGHYFDVFEATEPDFVSRVWLGEQYAGEQVYKGRSAERQHLNIPMSVVLEGEPKKNLVLQKEGEGRLYYRLGMLYAPKDLALDPLERGFDVSRKYIAVDDPADLSEDEDGRYHVALGATIRVEVSMTSRSRRYFVALVDKLPAGFEPLNPAFATTSALETASAMQGSWANRWFEHQNLRDERAEAFTSLLWEGTYTYSYLVRATTAGEFVVPPPKAEEMYSPETFGRGASWRVVVE